MRRERPRLLLLAGILLAGAPALAQTVFDPTADSFVRDGTANVNSNFGTASTLEVQTSTAGNNRDTYFKFDLSSIGTVGSARLRINVALSGAGTVITSAYAVADTVWNETGITWNNRPALGIAVASMSVTGTAASWYELDVTSYVRSEKAAGRNVVSLALHDAASSTVTVKVSSREGSSKPELIVTEGVATGPTGDSFVRDGTASVNTNYGTFSTLEVRTSTAGNNRDAYFKFDLSGVATVGSAKLRISAALSAAGTVGTSVYPVSDTAWAEAGITWNNRPALGAALANVSVSGTAANWYELDVTSYARGEKAAGRNTISLALHNAASSTVTVNVTSKEAASGKPELMIAANTPPTVSIASPAPGAPFTAPASIPITATASDDGSVARVEFFQGTNKLGEDTTSPYNFTWPGVAAGSYALMARATDNLGATATSATVIVVVNSPPTVSITSPLSGAVFAAPASIPITVTAADAGGSVAKVEFYQGAVKLGEDVTSAYSFTWASVAAGSYILTARAVDNLGAITTSSAVNVTVNNPPTVSIASPAAGAVFTAPASIPVTATAADAGGSVSKVEFFQGTTKLGESTTSPYSFTWASAAAGSYSLTAKATDNLGATKTSAAVSVTVNNPPTVSISSPAAGAVFSAPASIPITATASDPGGSIAKVEFFQGATKLGEDTTSPYAFTWAGAAVGNYSLTAKATDNLGATKTSVAVNITVTDPPTVGITSPVSGAVFTAPGSIPITATASDVGGSVAKVEFFQGTTKLGEDAASPYTFTWSGVVAGSYSLTAKATDDLGATRTSTAVSVIVNNPPTASITSPTSGAVFTAPATIPIAATASDAGGSVAKVEFFQGASKLGEDVTSPYSFTWVGVVAGSHILTAQATDNLGATKTSAAINVIVNDPPTVSIVSPTSGAVFKTPATIPIMATASDAGGSVAKVEFFQGASKLGEDTTSPYSFTWAGAAVGSYSLSAKATDNLGATATSPAITVAVAVIGPPPAGELAEGNAASWGTFASDAAVASVTNDTTRVKVGSKSLRFDTQSGFDTGVKYPASGALHWDLTGKEVLVFWIYAENPNLAFQGSQPLVVLNSPGGSFTYDPQAEAMYIGEWHLYQVPLAGDGQWLRTASGSPTLTDVTSLEIHHDTWGVGFTLYYDALEFATLSLTDLSLNPTTVTAGGQSTGTVTLSLPAPSSGIAIGLASSNAAAAVPTSVMVPADSSSTTFPVTTFPVSATTSLTIDASYLGITKSASLTVSPVPGPPVITLDVPLPAQVNSSPLAILGGVHSFAQVASLTVNAAPVPLTAGRFSVHVPLSFGNNAIVIQAVDVNGDSSALTGTVTFDSFSLMISILSPGTNEVFGFSPIAVTGRVEGIASGVSSLLVNGAPATLSGNLFQAQVDLLSGVNVIAADITAGNGQTSHDNRQVILDSDPPQISITSPSTDSLVRTPTVTVSGVATDNVGVVSILVNNVAATVAGTGFSASVPLVEGANLVVAAATDGVGRVSLAGIGITLDSVPPPLSVLTPTPGQTINFSSVLVSGDAGDESGVASVTVNGVAVQVIDGHFERLTTLAEGNNAIGVVAVDLAGNTRTVSVPVTRFSVPVVTITFPTNMSVLATSSTNVTGTVSNSAASVRVNGVSAAVSGGTFSATSVPLSEGGNMLTATATDPAGRAGTATVNVVRDLTAPRIHIDAPTDGATVFDETITVRGLANDVTMGSVNPGQVSLVVNGRPAVVANRGFSVDQIALSPGPNTIIATATDASGNTGQASITVNRDTAPRARVSVFSGNNQAAEIGHSLSQPLVAVVKDAGGQPVAGKIITFRVVGTNGSLDGGVRRRVARTDGTGRATVHFKLGSRSGVCNQLVEVSAVGFTGPAVFCASATPGVSAVLVVDSGDQQFGIAGQALPRPFAAVVTDTGFNRLSGVTVGFQVVKGSGTFGNGQQSISAVTDIDGRAEAVLILGSQTAVAGNVVETTVSGLPSSPVATFTATGKTAGEPGQTSVSGVVLDNMNVPVPGVTVKIKGTALQTPTDAQGQFRLPGAPVGGIMLSVDGATTSRPGIWAKLEYELVTIPGQDNTVGMPIYILPLDVPRGLVVDETHGGTLTLPELPGFSLTVQPGSVTFPHGGKSGVISVTLVHSDRVPMVPQFGQQPRFLITIQPAGAKFEPPAPITYPNVDGLAPGEVTELYSFDHDLGMFVAIGPGTVGEDGTALISNPGVGVLKAGWHCGGNPTSAGTAHNCPECETCVNGRCVPNPAADSTRCCNGKRFDPAVFCCFNGKLVKKNPVEDLSKCPTPVQHTQWPFEFDGCTGYPENPAGGSDTAFSIMADSPLPCDYHDRCYQTCDPTDTHRLVCDLELRQRAASVCMNSVENDTIKGRCIGHALTLYDGVRMFAGYFFWARQKQVCDCCP